MFDSIVKFFKKFVKEKDADSKDTAKERLHLVLMQDRANVSADFLELMKQEIIDVIKKYIDVDENSIDVKLTNKQNGDGTTGAPILYANIPIVSIKDENKNKVVKENKEKNNDNNKTVEEGTSKEENKEASSTENNEVKQEENIENQNQSEEISEENKALETETLENASNENKEMSAQEKNLEKDSEKEEVR